MEWILGLFIIVVVCSFWVISILLVKAAAVVGWLVVIATPFMFCWYKYGKKREKEMEGKMEEVKKNLFPMYVNSELPKYVIHVGINEDNEVVCKECIKKSDPDEKFVSSSIEGGGGKVTCVDCLCELY